MREPPGPRGVADRLPGRQGRRDRQRHRQPHDGHAAPSPSATSSSRPDRQPPGVRHRPGLGPGGHLRLAADHRRAGGDHQRLPRGRPGPALRRHPGAGRAVRDIAADRPSSRSSSRRAPTRSTRSPAPPSTGAGSTSTCASSAARSPSPTPSVRRRLVEPGVQVAVPRTRSGEGCGLGRPVQQLPRQEPGGHRGVSLTSSPSWCSSRSTPSRCRSSGAAPSTRPSSPRPRVSDRGPRARRRGQGGRVECLALEDGAVTVELRIEDVFIGDQTEAAIQIETVLGAKFIALVPRGSTALAEDADPGRAHRLALRRGGGLRRSVLDGAGDRHRAAGRFFETLSETFSDPPTRSARRWTGCPGCRTRSPRATPSWASCSAPPAT